MAQRERNSKLPGQRQGDQTAQRGAAHAGVEPIGQRAIFRVDERLHFLEQKSAIELALAAAVFPPLDPGVFADALGSVVDADHEERRDRVGDNQPVGSQVGVPGDAERRRLGVKEILAIVQVKNRVAACQSWS